MDSRRYPFNDRARQIVYNVHSHMRKEATECQNKVYEKEYFCKIQQRTAQATGVSIKTIKGILDQAAYSAAVTGRIDFSVSKTVPFRPDNVILDKKYYYAVEKTIRNYIGIKKKYPSLRYLLYKIKKDVKFPDGLRSLRKIVDEMGYYTTKHGIVNVKETQCLESTLDCLPKPNIDTLQIKEEKITDELPSSAVPDLPEMESSMELLPGIPFLNDPIIKTEVLEERTDFFKI